MPDLYTSPGLTSLNAVTTTTTGTVVAGTGGKKATATIVTGTGVDTGSAILEASHSSTYSGTWTTIDTVDLAALGASKSATVSYDEAYPFWRWRTASGAHNGTVTGYIQIQL
jgi:hypothetical protein